jgi:hypothetical protein
MRQELLRYWPHDEDVVACIKTDAEASSEAVSLAVHQPMRFERRIIGGSGSPEPCDEHQLLRAFLATDLPEERVILPIVGSSGVGKSHVVRWLVFQLGLCRLDRRTMSRAGVVSSPADRGRVAVASVGRDAGEKLEKAEEVRIVTGV